MRRDPLNIVQMLAEIAELEKSRAVADSLVKLSAERERLALLEQYLDEYAANRENESVDIEKLKSRSSFLSALTQAIGDQSSSIDQINTILEQRIETWREARANSKAVSRLTERRTQTRVRLQERREQAEIDSTPRPRR